MAPTSTETNTATLAHLSAFGQFIFPFANLLFPYLIWTKNKEKSVFIDFAGKEVLNFQLSCMLYNLVLLVIGIPLFIIGFAAVIDIFDLFTNQGLHWHDFNFSEHFWLVFWGVTWITVFGFLRLFEFFMLVFAALKTSKGENFSYPLSVAFIK